eukprot:gene3097-5267_t
MLMYLISIFLGTFLFYRFLKYYFARVKFPFVKKDIKIPEKPKEGWSKQIYSSKPGVVPDDLDVIVIGSGIGGLTIAGLLAKQGRRVLVLEQHDVAGGCCHVFEEEGFEFDTGIHYVGNMNPKDPNSTFITLWHLTDGKLKWESMGDVYDISVIAGDKTEWNQDLEITIKNLVKLFPKEEEKIRKYFKITNEVYNFSTLHFLYKIFPWYVASFMAWWYGSTYSQYEHKTCEEVMCGELGMSQELMFTLCYLSGDHGSLPTDKDSFIIQCMVSKHYTRNGGWYPIGGPGEIAETIIPIIESTGGKCLVKAKVEKILVKNNKAYGVVTSKGQEIKANLVISDAGVFNTYEKLLDQKITKKLNLPLDKIEPGMTHFYLFVGFDKSAEELKLPTANYWIHNSYDHRDISKYRDGDADDIQWEHSGYFISFPSSKDPTYKHRYPNKSTCVVVAEANYEWVKEWSDRRVKQRGGDYEKFKEEVQKNLLETLLKYFPQVKDNIKFMNVGTPLTNEFYLNSHHGSSYGLKYSSQNDYFKPKTPIDGLYLTGQDIVSMGFSGAVGGAMLCHAALTGDDIGSKLKKKYLEELKM